MAHSAAFDPVEPTRLARIVSRLDPLQLHSPRAALALGLVVAAALLFSLYDTQRTIDEAQAQTQLVADLAASEMAPRSADAPRAPAASSDAAIDDTLIVLSGSNGQVIASEVEELEVGAAYAPRMLAGRYVTARAPIAGALGHVTAAIPFAQLALEVLMRTGVLIGAGLVGVAAMAPRRRETASVPAPALPAPEPAPAAPVEPKGLSPLLDDVPFGLARWDAQGRLVSCNSAFSRLLSLDSDLARPGTAYDTVSRRLSGKISARPVLDQQHQRIIDIERTDGTAIMLDERQCEDGGFLAIVSDISERKRADALLSSIREEQKQLAKRYHEEKIRAEAASRAKTAFLAHLSHDIRTPLNHIIGFAELMRLETYGPIGDSRYETYIGDIKSSGEKLLAGFADILEYAELEGGRKSLKVESVEISDLLKRTISRFAGRAETTGVDIHLGDCPHAVISADRHCIERMMANLVENAITYTARGGEVRVSAWTDPHGVVLEVTDTGIGIPEDQLERLSQPFALSDATFAKAQDGIGLGLAIARTIAELSGGELAIDSMAAVGTTVAVALPRLADHEHLPERTARAA